jgi:hypothetical protein
LILSGNTVRILKYTTIPTFEHLGATICSPKDAKVIASFLAQSGLVWCFLTRFAVQYPFGARTHYQTVFVPTQSSTLHTLELTFIDAPDGVVPPYPLLCAMSMVPRLETFSMNITVLQIVPCIGLNSSSVGTTDLNLLQNTNTLLLAVIRCGFEHT